MLQGNGEDVSPSASRHERVDTTASVRDEPPPETVVGGEAERHYVEAGPAWRPKVPPFRILVHSPSKRNSGLSGAYTMFSVTSLFDAPSYSDEDAEYPDDQDDGADSHMPGSPVRITVHRRFSHFVVLHTALTRRLPGIALPPLPEKQYAGRFSADFVEARRGDLERYLSRVVRHPIARYAEVLTFFLGCESDLVCVYLSFHLLYLIHIRLAGMEETVPGVSVAATGWTHVLCQRLPSCVQPRHRRSI